MTPGRGLVAIPYCGTAPLPADLMNRWNLDPVLLVAIAIGTAFLWRLASARADGKRSLVAASAAVSLFLFASPFCALTSALFSARVVHHILLTAALAPMLAFGLPRIGLPKARSLAYWTFAQAAVFWAWHAPPLYSEALSNSALYWLMQASLLGSSLGFWLSLRHSDPIAAVGALLGTTVQMGLLGAVITFADQPIYAPHLATTSPWGLSALADQQLAGLVMWVPAAAIYLAAALLIAASWLKAEDRIAA